MSISTLYTPDSYVGNGVDTIFTYTFKIFEDSNIQAYVDGVLQDPSTYTVDGVGNDNGGDVTFNVAPANAAEVVFKREVPRIRVTDLQQNSKLYAGFFNDEYDRVFAILQEVGEQYGLAITIDESFAGSFDAEIPVPIAGKSLKVSDDGGSFEWSAYNIDTLVDDANAAKVAAELAEANAAASKAATDTNLTDSNTAKTDAETARDLAQSYASSVNLPDVTGSAGKGIRIKDTEDGYEVATFVDPSVATQFTAQQNFTAHSLSVTTGNATFDVAAGNSAILTLTENVTLQNITNAVADGFYWLAVKQDGTGGFTLAFDTEYVFNTNVPTIKTDANSITILGFYHNGTNALVWEVY